MSLLPSVTLEKFIEKIKDGTKIPSVEVFYNNEYKGTFIAPNMHGGASIFGEIRNSASFLGVRGNIVVPQGAFDSLKEDTPQYPNLVKAREARQLKRGVTV